MEPAISWMDPIVLEEDLTDDELYERGLDVYLTAERAIDGSVHLIWLAHGTGTLTDEFTITRKYEGTQIFTPIGTLLTDGTSDQFEFRDIDISDKKASYCINYKINGIGYNSNIEIINGTTQIASIEVFPNPVTEKIMIRFSGSDLSEGIEQVHLSIVNLSGQQVYTSDCNAHLTNTLTVTAVSQFPAGMYVMMVEQEGKLLSSYPFTKS